MISLSSYPSASLSSSVTLLFLAHPIRSRCPAGRSLHAKKYHNLGKKRNLRCRAELSQEAPFVLAIGSCVLNSLIFPVTGDSDDGDADGGSGINSTDARFAVMGIISFIPYFNWLSWIFAWLDTGRQRYLVYSIVYLAPYIRFFYSHAIYRLPHTAKGFLSLLGIYPWSTGTNLSLSPDESWLPLSSIIFCIAHIQLEASIRNGDIKTSELFGEALKFLSPIKSKKDAHMPGHEGHEKERNKERMKLHSTQEEARNKLGGRGVPRKPLDDVQRQTDDQDNKRKD